MPLGNPQPVQLFPAQINVPTDNGLFISISVQGDGTQAADAVEVATLSLVDLLQDWPGRHPLADVTAQLYNTEMVPATPTNPIPPPPPPVDPPTE